MISAIGSDVATWHPPPPSYEIHGRTHGPGLWSYSRSQLGDAPEDALDLGIRAEPLVLVKRHSRTLEQTAFYPPRVVDRRRLLAIGLWFDRDCGGRLGSGDDRRADRPR